LAPCWVQTPPERVNTHAAPRKPLSARPPISAVWPSADSAALMPYVPAPLSSIAVSLAPCWLQRPPERVNTHAAPTPPASLKPPTSAVSPSADSAALKPKRPRPDMPLLVSLAPCWMNGSIRSG
jgi:hypothetical protein